MTKNITRNFLFKGFQQVFNILSTVYQYIFAGFIKFFINLKLQLPIIRTNNIIYYTPIIPTQKGRYIK